MTTTLAWDAEERATSISGTSGGTYTYNGIGQRVRKVEGSNTFNYTRESDAIDGAVLSDGAASYTQSAEGLVAENRGGTSSYYHSDVLGTTRSLTSSTQTRTDTFQFDAFGLSTGRTGTNATPFGFVGGKGYQADSSGLMLLGHRLYDASTGRFLSRDPIQDGDNWYIYCNNDPVDGSDPEGLDDDWIIPKGPTPKFPLPQEPIPPTVPVVPIIAVIVIIDAGVELGTYQPGQPTGPLTWIGDTIGQALFPIDVAPRNPDPPRARNGPPAARYHFPTKKGAYEAAKRRGGGVEPVLDPDQGNGPHYHPGDPDHPGDPSHRHPRYGHDHYYYPKR